MTVGQEAALEARKVIDAERRKLCDKMGLSLPRLLKELKAIALSDMTDYVAVSDDGSLQCKSTDEIKRAKRPAIKKIKEHTRITESADGERIWKDSRTEYELHDKQKAISTILEIRGDLKQEQEVAHTGTIIVRTGVPRSFDRE